jgi:ubiquinone/menaquinone biosynthesis C-methylase UbiE
MNAAIDWDYSRLAASYDLRPDYCAELVRGVLAELAIDAGSRLLDVGAGTGKLTRLLCETGATVIACEPNGQMRAIGAGKADCPGSRWLAARGQALPVGTASVDLVAYGSSFNVLPAAQALDECARVLRPGGHLLALWNHRDLDDPLQRDVEAVIHHHLPGFDYGRRRQDPAPVLAGHGGFAPAQSRQSRFVVELDARAWLQAWRSHATLQRQAGDRLDSIIDAIAALLAGRQWLQVPYHTRAWWAQSAA